MADPIRAVTQAARQYRRVEDRHAALEAQLARAADDAEASWQHVRALIPAAFASCADTAAWRELKRRITDLSGEPDLLVEVELPPPRDGSDPWDA